MVNNYWPQFGPRIGFAYDLTGRGKTVVRGGFGIMYDRIQGNDMYNGATNTPFDASPTIHNVALSNPGLDVTTGGTISAAALPILPVGITGIALNYKPPTSYQYSVGVQQALGSRSVLGLSYVGSQGRHENYYQEVNLPSAAALPGLVASGGTGINQLYQYRGYGGIRMSVDGANAHYNSLQVDLHGNMTRDLQMQFGYTLARAVDATDSNGSGGDLNNVTNPYVGWRYDLGPSVFRPRKCGLRQLRISDSIPEKCRQPYSEVNGGRMGAVGNRHHGIGSSNQPWGEWQHGLQRHPQRRHVYSTGRPAKRKRIDFLSEDGGRMVQPGGILGPSSRNMGESGIRCVAWAGP